MSDSLGESAGSSIRTYSSVWSHFTLVENDEKAQCNYCGDSLGESAGSSTRTYSSVWSHFTLVENDEKAQCNYCGTTYKRTGGNTTNLHKHMQRKHSSKIETEVESGEIDKFVKKELPRYTQGTFRDFIVRWTVCDDQPFTAVESEHLRLLFRILNPIAKAPSADTLRSD
ncbi:zf-BED-domain-containing protein, partial [Rhizophagus irregularis]